ncbi:MAG: isoprenyl transferase [Bacteroidaceae bacterium]|nr:isoprenyl transferase [Bacteroidaceae bacterium]
MNYLEKIDKNNIPRHVAIIMDGNGRWAQMRGLDRSMGHKAGAEAVHTLVENCVNLGIRYLTLYTFSTENWKRPAAEVAALMSLLMESIEEQTFMKNNVAFKVIGDMEKLPAEVRERLEGCIARTSKNDSMSLVLALSYSSRWEVTDAVRSLASKVKAGEIMPEDIDENTISASLTTNFMPDPDLLIRTGREVRLSNFLLWQAAYSELYFTDVLWPEFNEQELCKAVYEYQHRQRRYGLTGEQVTNEENND